MRYCFFFLYQKFGIKPLKQYSYGELKTLLDNIDKEKITATAKRRYVCALANLIDVDREPYLGEGRFYNDVKYEFLFHKKRINSGQGFREMGNSRQKHRLTAKEWVHYLEMIKKIHPFHYIELKFFLSGCRIGGLVQIQVKNIHFHQCCFDTLEKPTQNQEHKKVRYFFPMQFSQEIHWYIDRMQLSENDYLFPYYEKQKPTDKISVFMRAAVVRRHTYLYGDYRPHDFRRSIKRLWKQAGMDPVDRMVLCNQQAPDKDEKGDLLKTDAIYSQEDLWERVDTCQKIYQQYYDLIFSKK